MKKFLFKGERVDNGEIVYGDLYQPNQVCEIYPEDNSFGVWIIDRSFFEFFTWYMGSKAGIGINATEVKPESVKLCTEIERFNYEPS